MRKAATAMLLLAAITFVSCDATREELDRLEQSKKQKKAAKESEIKSNGSPGQSTSTNTSTDYSPEYYATARELSDYADRTCDEAKKRTGGYQGIKGKVFVHGEPSAVSLSQDLEAKTRDELGTIIHIDRREVLVDHYQDYGGAYIVYLDVSVIDPSIPAVAMKRSFRGGQPPMVKYTAYGADAYGDLPYDAVQKFVESLKKM